MKRSFTFPSIEVISIEILGKVIEHRWMINRVPFVFLCVSLWLKKKEVIMLELLKEMGTMCGKLQEFINKTKNKDDQKKLMEKYVQLSTQVEKMANKILDENDGFYLETMVKVVKTEQVVKEFNAQKIEFIDVLMYLINIIANVDKVLLGWKTGNGK